ARGSRAPAGGAREPDSLNLWVVVLDLFEVAVERLCPDNLVPSHAAQMLADAGRDQLVGLEDVQGVLAKDVDRMECLLLGIAQHAGAILPGYGAEQQCRDEQRGGNKQRI